MSVSKPTKRETYTTGEAAKRLGVAPMTVRGMCERGELPGAKRIGTWWRIPVDSVEAYIPDDGHDDRAQA